MKRAAALLLSILCLSCCLYGCASALETFACRGFYAGKLSISAEDIRIYSSIKFLVAQKVTVGCDLLGITIKSVTHPKSVPRISGQSG